jgi:hypothetical protein
VLLSPAAALVIEFPLSSNSASTFSKPPVATNALIHVDHLDLGVGRGDKSLLINFGRWSVWCMEGLVYKGDLLSVEIGLVMSWVLMSGNTRWESGV